MSEWQSWIGRTLQSHDRINAGLCARWLATLDRAGPADGTMPQGLHWCLCVPDSATSALGPDGHPLRDESAEGFLPPVPLPRRMWASSKVDFFRPLMIGAEVSRKSTIVSVSEKTGSSGHLVFVNIGHETSCDGEVAVRETQTVVYRAAAAAGAGKVPPPPGDARIDLSDWRASRLAQPSETLLFRFSALTFNSHRIHYDLPYATREEGYRGLVVHGPLTATLLLDLAQAELGDNALKSFSFRGLSPAICGEPLHLAMRGADDVLELAAFAEDGRQVMAAMASA